MIQRLYRLWVILMMLSGAVALYFVCGALAGMWKYANLGEKAPIQFLSMHIKPLSFSRFGIEADYSYRVGEREYRGSTLLEKPRFLHAFAAENYLLLTAHKKPQEVFFSKRHPSLSSLENVFPCKRCLLALIALNVFVYFYFARNLLLKFVSYLLREHDGV